MRLDRYLQRPLENQRVELFQIDGSNLSLTYLDWLHDPKVGRFLEARFKEHTPETLLSFIQGSETSDSALLLGIRRKDNGAYIGNIKLNWDPNHRVGDIGIIIGDTESWGLGLAPTAISLMCRIGFMSVGLRKIMAGAYATNQGSIRAFQKCGFRIEATLADQLLLNGVPENKVLMRLFQSEFIDMGA